MGRGKGLLKNTLILSLGTVFPKVVHFIALPILTAYLSKEEYGYYDVIVTAVSFFLPLVTLQIQLAAFRYLIEYREAEEEKKKIITNILFFTIGISILALIILYIALYKFDFVFKIVLCTYFLVDMLISVVRQIVRGLGQNKTYANSVILESVIYIIGIFLFVFWGRKGLVGTLGSVIISLILTLIYVNCKVHLTKYIDIKTLDKKLVRELLSYSIPMIPNSMSRWIIQMSDRLVITAVMGVEANAVYAVANKLPALYRNLQSTFTLAWQENASIASKDQDADKYYSEMFDAMYGVFFGIIAMLIAATPVLFPILVKGDYEGAYAQIPILYIAAFFSSLASYLGGVYVAYKETKKIGITTIVAAATNLLVDIVLVNRIGIYAGSVSTLISYILLVICRMIGVQKFLKMEFKIKKMMVMLVWLILLSALLYFKNLYINILNSIIAVILALIYNKALLRVLLKSVKSRNNRC